MTNGKIENIKLNSNFGGRGWFLTIFTFFCFYLNTFTLGTMNLAVPVLSQQTGWSATTMFSFNSIAGWITIAFLFLSGYLAQKSPKILIVVSLLVYGICVIIWGQAVSLVQWILFLILINVLGASYSWSGTSVLIANWFPRKKGLVIGWASIGLPLAGATSVLLFSILMGKFGISGAYTAIGGFGIILAIIGFIFLHNNPEDVGCYPDNDRSVTREQLLAMQQEGLERAKASIWTPTRLFKTKEVWMIAISIGIQFMVAVGVMGQLIPKLLAMGFEQNIAIMIMTIGGLIACVGSYLCGVLDSKVGPRKAAIITHIVAIIGLVLGIFPSLVVLIISAACLGAVVGGSSNYPVSLCVTCWGRYDFPRAYKIVFPIINGIGTSGMIVVAVTAAKFGSYSVSYLILAGLSVIGILLLLGVNEGFAKKVETRINNSNAASNLAQSQ